MGRTLVATVCELRAERLAEDWPALAEHVRAHGSDLVLLPEMGLSPWFARRRAFDAAAWRAAVEAHERHLAERLGELAPAAVLGSAPVERDGRRQNEAFVAGSDGPRAAHRKYHLPDEEDFWEASWYERGDGAFALAEAGEARVGFLICTELWFSQHARAYGEGGAHIVAVPRCTPVETLGKWLAGGRAAAVISGAYVLSSNHGDERFGGQGWVIDPDGEVLALTTPEEPFASVEIDLDRAEGAKRSYPRYVDAGAPHALLLRRLHEAQGAFYAGGAEEPLRALLTEDVVWRIPGDNAIAGVYEGIEAVVAYFARRRDLAARTFRMHPGEVLSGDGEHAAVLTDGTAVVGGRERRWSTVGLYRFRGGRIAACSLLALDQRAFDAAWSPGGP